MPNENVETNQYATNEDKTNGQDGITNDENDVNLYLDDEVQSESYSKILSESNEETSHPSSKEQIIRQHKFYIHSAWLAVQSSYFRSLFFSGMKGSNTNEVHVQISTSEEQAHLLLLEATYKIDTLDKANFDQLLKVLKLAQKYDVKFVFKKCKYCLHDMMDSLEICKKIIYFIKIDNAIPDVEDLIRKIQSFLAKEFSPLDKTWQTTSFKELCEPLLRYLLSSDELVTVSENTVFHALMYWIEERGIENVLESEELPSLLSVVRFELIPFDYLYNVVQHNPVAKKLMDFNDHYLRGITYHAFSNTVKQRLPHQPVKRRAETQPFVAFTWVIPTYKFDVNTPKITEKTLKSEEFWYCGYKMRLVIANIVKVKDLRKNCSMFKAKLCLQICNLAQESEVSIQWQPTSPCFKFFPKEKTKTFDRKACWSSVTIIYEMRVKVAFSKQKGRSIAARRIRASAQTSFTLGAASSTPTTTVGEAHASTTKPSFNLGAASSTSSTTFDGPRAPFNKPSFNISAASPTQTTTFAGVRVPDTKPSFNIGAASSTPSTTFDGVCVPTTKPSFNIGAASSTPTTTFDGVRVPTTKPSFNLGAASSTPTTTFGEVHASTTKPSLIIGAASFTPTTTFAGVRVSTTKPSFNLGTAPSTPTTTFGEVRMSTTQSYFNAGASSGINTSIAPSSFCNPLFSFGTWSTNTAKANKSDSMSEQENSNSSYVQIDVIMKLV